VVKGRARAGYTAPLRKEISAMKEKHNLAAVVEQMETPTNEPPEVTAKVHRLMTTSNFNLQGIESKCEVIRETPLCTG
jgi:hypothetical protein